MNFPAIVHKGFKYHYCGQVCPWDRRLEKTRACYKCMGCDDTGEVMCRAVLWKVVPLEHVTEEPEWVEEQDKHNHPPSPDWMYPYPFMSLVEYQNYIDGLRPGANVPTPQPPPPADPPTTKEDPPIAEHDGVGGTWAI